MKKYLGTLLFALTLTQTVSAATLLAGYYDRARQFVEVNVGYCIDRDLLPDIAFHEGLCRPTFPASCDVLLDIQNENLFPHSEEECGSEWLSYDVLDLPKPVILNFLANDGSVGSILVD